MNQNRTIIISAPQYLGIQFTHYPGLISIISETRPTHAFIDSYYLILQIREKLTESYGNLIYNQGETPKTQEDLKKILSSLEQLSQQSSEQLWLLVFRNLLPEKDLETTLYHYGNWEIKRF